ncbi:MAG TPA: phosphate ABC transporter permease subunit PstC [Gaiellaceae bacterium]|nr:phosphate ABC transporter permease subunit PstC [Gaiellaceae bacterium]
MSTFDATSDAARRPFKGRRTHFGDLILQVTAGLAAAGAIFLVGMIIYKVVEGARLSLSTFGLGFLTHTSEINGDIGGKAFLIGTAVTSIGALALATPLALGVALFLSELAPGWIRGPVTALVETLAAIPSVVIGLWGIIVLIPNLRLHVMPALHSTLGFIPLFGPVTGTGASIFAAIIVLTIMILPIIASISRELFLGVPAELKEGALALGTTRWEMVRGVVFPFARGGVAAAMILGLARALGEAIAVSMVIGAFNGFSWNLFSAGDTLAGRLANDYSSPGTAPTATSSLFYLAVILLVFSIVVNLIAQVIVRRAERRQGLVR